MRLLAVTDIPQCCWATHWTVGPPYFHYFGICSAWQTRLPALNMLSATGLSKVPIFWPDKAAGFRGPPISRLLNPIGKWLSDGMWHYAIPETHLIWPLSIRALLRFGWFPCRHPTDEFDARSHYCRLGAIVPCMHSIWLGIRYVFGTVGGTVGVTTEDARLCPRMPVFHCDIPQNSTLTVE